MSRESTFLSRFAMRGVGVRNAANFGTIALFNNSPGPHVLMVRDLNAFTSSGVFVGSFFYTKTRLNGTAGTVVPMFPDQGTLPGVIDQSDQASGGVQDYFFSQAVNFSFQWSHDFPLAIIPPAWSFVVQNLVTTQQINVSFIWEVLLPEQLEHYFDKIPLD